MAAASKNIVSWKRVELAVNRSMKFAEITVDRLNGHKKNILQSERDGDRAAVKAEIKRAQAAIVDLRKCLSEMERFRPQLDENDWPKYDAKFAECAQVVNGAIQNFRDLDSDIIEYLGQDFRDVLAEEPAIHNESSDLTTELPKQQKSQTLIGEEIDAELMKDNEERTFNIEKDLEDVAATFHDMASMVKNQAAKVNSIEDNIESSKSNFLEGGKQLGKAIGYKAAGFTVMGAAIGALVGGPVGLLAGTKLGLLAAGAGGTVGVVAGRKLKRATVEQNEVELQNLNAVSDMAETKTLREQTVCISEKPTHESKSEDKKLSTVSASAP